MKIRVMIVACALFFAVGGAHSQEVVQASPAPAAATPAVKEASGDFDGYRALVITAGVVGGAVVAAILTDGLIIPTYAYLTGAEAGGIGAAAGAGHMWMSGAGTSMASHSGYSYLGAGMRLLGAVSGGLYADSKYMGDSGK